MDNITLGQIKEIVAWIVAFGIAVGTIYAFLVKATTNKFVKPLTKQMSDDKKELKEELTKLKGVLTTALREEKMERLKTDLTSFICLADRDIISEGQKIRAHDEYDEYIKLGGNSNIHNDFERLVKGGKI